MPVDDVDLVLAARSGDRAAWAGIYDRYADRLHDFCSSVLRDKDEAADAAHDTFITAFRKLDQLRDPSRLRPWLFAIARNEALGHSRRRGRAIPTEELEVTSTGVTPEDAAETEELRALVWAAAAGLVDRDRAALDLHLRQGLEGAALGEALGTTANNANVMMSRLRDQVERALGAYLVARRGRADCAGLDGLLKGWDQEFTPLWRKRIARHVDNCPTCSENRSRLASPLALLAGVAVLPAPSQLRDRVLGDIHLISASKPTGDARRRKRLTNVILAAAVLFLLSAIAMRALDDGSRVPSPLANAEATAENFLPAPTIAGDATPTSTPPDGATVTSTKGGSAATTPTTPPASTTTVRPPTVTTAPPPTTTTLPPVRVSATSRSTQACSGQSVAVTATVTGGTGGYTTVTIKLVSPRGSSSSSGMNFNGSNWAGNMTPAEQGQATWWVVATDSSGHTGESAHQTIQVNVCPQ